MTADRLFYWAELGVFLCWMLLGVTRVMTPYACGIPVLSADRRRSAVELLVDLVLAMGLLLWAYRALVISIWFDSAPLPSMLTHLLVDSWTIRIVGICLLMAGLVVYSRALFRLGKSWRIGIDRDSPGPLVTDGIYAFTRHPIYVAFDLLFVGTILVLGQSVFVLFVAILVPILHLHMLREERFLVEQYGEDYREYCARVGRYFGRANLLSVF